MLEISHTLCTTGEFNGTFQFSFLLSGSVLPNLTSVPSTSAQASTYRKMSQDKKQTEKMSAILTVTITQDRIMPSD